MSKHSGFFYKKRVYFFLSLLYNAIMKKLLIIFTLIAIIICSFVTPLSVSADSGDFVLITEKNCKFYLLDQKSFVHKFSIPTTYYVKVLNTQSEHFLLVEYMGYVGYIENVDGAQHETNVEAPYHGGITITLLPNVDLRKGAPDSRDKYEWDSSKEVISVVGEYVDGASVKWYALMLNDDTTTLYYAKAVDTSNPNVVFSPHQNSISSPTPPSNEEKGDENGDGVNNTVVRAILIIGIIIPALIILFLIFKPGKKVRKRRYQEEDSRHYDDYDGYYRK